MNPDYQTRVFPYTPCAEQQPGAATDVRPVVVVGAGPVGLATAIDLAQQGVPVVLVDDDCTLSTGSRAICFSKRALEIFDRLGCGDRMVGKGVSWNVGKVFLKDALLYRFDLLPETGHRRPAFINLQQYYVEGFLVERAQALPNLELRWKHQVTGLAQDADGVTLTIDTPDGAYALRARYVVAADGSRSSVRRMMGLETHGQTFKDRFLIADVRMKADFPNERWFWFDPPFHPNQSVLLHHQPDNVWRIDFQLGWDADPVAEKQPERVLPARARCSATTWTSSWNGSASIPSRASGWTASVMAACCSRATRRTGSRRSARAAPTAACRTRRTWPGSCAWCSTARRPTPCSTPTPANASWPPTRTSATPPTRPTSSRPKARPAASSAMRCCGYQALRLCAHAGQQRTAVDAHRAGGLPAADAG